MIELDHFYLAELIEAYWENDSLDVRLALLNAIIEHRQPDSLNFYVDAFEDCHPEIWQTALNGFFVVDRTEAPRILAELKAKYGFDEHKNKERLEWLDEVISQLGDKAIWRSPMPVWKHLTEILDDYANEQQIDGEPETFEHMLHKTNF